jgi:hypothetical protein
VSPPSLTSNTAAANRDPWDRGPDLSGARRRSDAERRRRQILANARAIFDHRTGKVITRMKALAYLYEQYRETKRVIRQVERD